MPMPPSVSLRYILAVRSSDGSDSPPGPWRVAAATAGVSGADAFLCQLARSITGAQERVTVSAEAARDQLMSLRGTARAEDKPHLDELEAQIAAAERGKFTALEREETAVDTVLERLRAERGAVAEAVATLSDTELEARHADMSARLDTAEAPLLALPTTVIEPPYVGVVIDEAAVLAGAAVFGRVVVPRAITAAALTLNCAPSHAYPGCTIMFQLVIEGALGASQSDDELEASLAAAAAVTHIEAPLTRKVKGAVPQLLRADICADVPGRCVTISIGVPEDVPIGSLVCFGPLTVSGQPVAGLLGPLVVQVRSVSNAKHMMHNPSAR